MKLFERMAVTCRRAIEVSLTVVADVKDDGVKKEAKSDGSEKGCAALNVNTGAIGANATFASLESSNDEDTKDRFATQRVIVSDHWSSNPNICSNVPIF